MEIVYQIFTGLFVTVVGGLIVGIALDTVRINTRTITISMTSKIYVSPYDSGSFVFDYSNNNGTYIIGLQERGFTTKWSKASDTSIHACSDSADIDSIALIKNVKDLSSLNLINADFSSRCRTPRIGDAVVWKNINGYYAVTKIVSIKDDSRGDTRDELECQYVIFK